MKYFLRIILLKHAVIMSLYDKFISINLIYIYLWFIVSEMFPRRLFKKKHKTKKDKNTGMNIFWNICFYVHI